MLGYMNGLEARNNRCEPLQASSDADDGPDKSRMGYDPIMPSQVAHARSRFIGVDRGYELIDCIGARSSPLASLGKALSGFRWGWKESETVCLLP